jgi:hypothetical protein
MKLLYEMAMTSCGSDLFAGDSTNEESPSAEFLAWLAERILLSSDDECSRETLKVVRVEVASSSSEDACAADLPSRLCTRVLLHTPLLQSRVYSMSHCRSGQLSVK